MSRISVLICFAIVMAGCKNPSKPAPVEPEPVSIAADKTAAPPATTSYQTPLRPVHYTWEYIGDFDVSQGLSRSFRIHGKYGAVLWRTKSVSGSNFSFKLILYRENGVRSVLFERMGDSKQMNGVQYFEGNTAYSLEVQTNQAFTIRVLQTIPGEPFTETDEVAPAITQEHLTAAWSRIHRRNDSSGATSTWRGQFPLSPTIEKQN